jgi:hypothetical protein
MQSTALSSLPMCPEAMSFLAPATVTPPAVSAKMPAYSASIRMPSTTSSSDTSSAEPPVCFMEWIA